MRHSAGVGISLRLVDIASPSMCSVDYGVKTMKRLLLKVLMMRAFHRLYIRFETSTVYTPG